MPDEVALKDQHALQSEVTTKDSIAFRVVKDEQVVFAFEIRPPLHRAKTRYPYIFDEMGRPEYGYVHMGYSSNTIQAGALLAVAEAMQIASDLLSKLNDECAETLAYQEQSKREYELQLKQQESAELEAISKFEEHVKWYAGEKFKMRVKGRRSTIFGTIGTISNSFLHTTSERGVPMMTPVLDVESIHVMPKGERKYSRVFP